MSLLIISIVWLTFAILFPTAAFIIPLFLGGFMYALSDDTEDEPVKCVTFDLNVPSNLNDDNLVDNNKQDHDLVTDDEDLVAENKENVPNETEDVFISPMLKYRKSSSFGRLSANSFSTPLNPSIESFNFPNMYSAVKDADDEQSVFLSCNVSPYLDQPTVKSIEETIETIQRIETKSPRYSLSSYNKPTIKFSVLKDLDSSLAERVLCLRRRHFNSQANKNTRIHLCSLTLTGECKRILPNKTQASIHCQRMHSNCKNVREIAVLQIPSTIEDKPSEKNLKLIQPPLNCLPTRSK